MERISKEEKRRLDREYEAMQRGERAQCKLCCQWSENFRAFEWDGGLKEIKLDQAPWMGVRIVCDKCTELLTVH